MARRRRAAGPRSQAGGKAPGLERKRAEETQDEKVADDVVPGQERGEAGAATRRCLAEHDDVGLGLPYHRGYHRVARLAVEGMTRSELGPGVAALMKTGTRSRV